jgi:L-lactate dehydrogenase complex protein LldG
VSEARDAILARLRAALGDVPADEEPSFARTYRLRGTLPEADRVRLFVERVEDYGASVTVTDDPGTACAAALAGQGARRIVVPPDLHLSLRPPGLELVEDDRLDAATLDALDGVVTTCAAACAETGTIALDGGTGQGRRATTLVPDLHVCVVEAAQIVETFPELLERLEPAARAGRPIVLVSGPSATSDIELARVEGVHGPRRLVVIVRAP